MSRRKVSALALIAAGALVFTPVTIPTTHAATVNEDATHHHNVALRDDAPWYPHRDRTELRETLQLAVLRVDELQGARDLLHPP